MASTLSVDRPRAPGPAADRSRRPGSEDVETTCRRTRRTSTRPLRAEIDEARARVAEVPAEVVVINHAMGLYELARHPPLGVPARTWPAPPWPSTPSPAWSRAWATGWGPTRPRCATPWRRSAWPSSRSRARGAGPRRTLPPILRRRLRNPRTLPPAEAPQGSFHHPPGGDPHALRPQPLACWPRAPVPGARSR